MLTNVGPTRNGPQSPRRHAGVGRRAGSPSGFRTATDANESHAVTDALNDMIARIDPETEMRTHTSTAGIRLLSKAR